MALELLTTQRTPIKAVAMIPGRADTVAVALFEASSGETYPWTTEARMTADELDFVARAADVVAQPPLLLVSGERDHSALRTDAAPLVDALCEQYANPGDVELITVPALSHPWPTNPAESGPATALGQGCRWAVSRPSRVEPCQR